MQPDGWPLPPAVRQRIIAAMRRWLTILVLLVAILRAPGPRAQDPQAPAAPRQPQPPVLVDAVVATVNDSTILLSELRTLAAGRIRTIEARSGPLSGAEVQRIYRDELEERIDVYRMAQSAKTFGVVAPEQVEQLFRAELERDKQDQVRDLGSYLEFSRELQRQGRTWQAYEREQRIEKLYDFAQSFSVWRRIQKQQNLYLTPRMLRETYAANRDRFVRSAQARVALVSFRGPNAQANAEQAAAMWSLQNLTSRELAQRFPDALATQDLNASSLRPELREFGEAGPLNTVSPPMVRPGGVDVAKVIAYLPARNGKFEDREVQEELRELCHRQVLGEFRHQALERARARTEVWITPSAR
jgi:hypothetical protein